MSYLKQVVAVIDWPLLQNQKDWLIFHSKCTPAQGLINLIDALQDAAIQDGLATQSEVFDDPHT